ncbi:MAG: helix-hairpin-helix domain-containing protein [Acidobacteria bacterium]|nr:helix-hairpin-helix domain-containing protein [Acidobacteriota bacterium]
MKHVIRYLAIAVVLSLTVAAAIPALHAQKAPASGTAKISINTAGADQLAILPGVGPATAQRIVEFRAKNGPFKRLEDLMGVKGMGEKKFLKLKDQISL